MLDPDRADTIRLSLAEAPDLSESALNRIGYPTDEAAIIVDQLIDNALRRDRFASLPRIRAIAEDAKTGKPCKPMRIVRETPVSALIDGGNKVAYVAADRGAEIAIARPKASGMTLIGIHNGYYSSHTPITWGRSSAPAWCRSTPPAPSRTAGARAASQCSHRI